MRMLVTLEQARQHLRRDLDNTGPDPDLTAKIVGASEAVLAYLKSQADRFLDSSGNVFVDSAEVPIVPGAVVSATLLMVGYLDVNRGSDDEGAFERGELPRPVTALLYPLRDPALA